LKNPPILILDEATSALDTVTEALVQEALNNVMENRTVFAIAHRLSTIRNADKIIVLNKGKIAEAGTHDELMKLQGMYYDLNMRQHGA
ncbi:MAG: multidrug ABC transporter permease, partial [Victivallaceae bacterium]